MRNVLKGSLCALAVAALVALTAQTASAQGYDGSGINPGGMYTGGNLYGTGGWGHVPPIYNPTPRPRPHGGGYWCSVRKRYIAYPVYQVQPVYPVYPTYPVYPRPRPCRGR